MFNFYIEQKNGFVEVHAKSVIDAIARVQKKHPDWDVGYHSGIRVYTEKMWLHTHNHARNPIEIIE